MESGGTGIHAEVLDDLKDQLIIVLLKRLKTLGHSLEFPVEEVDNTARDLVSFRIVDRVFHFEIWRKS